MPHRLHFLFAVFTALGVSHAVLAQGPDLSPPSKEPKQVAGGSATLGLPMVATPALFPLQQAASKIDEDLDRLQKSIDNLRKEKEVILASQQDDPVKKRFDLLQKQIEIQQKLIDELIDQVKKQPLAGTPVDKLQSKVATLEARSKQAAQRDLELSHIIDDIREERDAERRNGPELPATLKELFLPSQTNESPLSIYGHLVFNYNEFNGRPGSFGTPDFGPFFLLQLNEQFLLEAHIDINNAGVGTGTLQLDYVMTDWLTAVAGRFVTPIGFFNERLNVEWINKLPDEAIMFRQVSPQSSTDGIQLRGATYLGGLPIKMEYSLYGGNGLQLGQAPASYTQVADFGGLVAAPR